MSYPARAEGLVYIYIYIYIYIYMCVCVCILILDECINVYYILFLFRMKKKKKKLPLTSPRSRFIHQKLILYFVRTLIDWYTSHFINVPIKSVNVNAQFIVFKFVSSSAHHHRRLPQHHFLTYRLSSPIFINVFILTRSYVVNTSRSTFLRQKRRAGYNESNMIHWAVTNDMC